MSRHLTFCLFDCWQFVPIRWVGPGNELFQWSFNISVCLIAEDLSQSAGYDQLQWSFNLSVCLIASDLSQYVGYKLFQWSYSVCLICPDPLGLSRSARFVPIRLAGPGYELCDTIYHVAIAFDTKQVRYRMADGL